MQFVFIIPTGDQFAIIETAELWEEPKLLGEGTSYFCYPTVFGHQRFATKDEAAAFVAATYTWTVGLPQSSGRS